jgi:ATP-dependent helicase/nuclease subunit B
MLTSLPPHAPFAPTLAQALWDAAKHDAERLVQFTVLLPTQRATRALGQALVRVSGRDALVLPTLRAIGDLAPDEAPLESPDIAVALPPAISADERLYVLARLILAKESASGRTVSLRQALVLARGLCGLLDAAAYEDAADLSRAATLVEGPFAAHWQQSATFLALLSDAWPAYLAAQNRMDPSVRRMALIRALTHHWRDTPPPHPVWMAGSTGALPAVADMIGVVHALPQGTVVLRGLDLDLDTRAWDTLDDGHPQKAMKLLLDRLGLQRADVTPFPGLFETAQQRARRRLIAASLTPVEASDDWPQRISALRAEGDGDTDPIAKGADGLSLFVAADEDDAALGIAIRTREALEAPNACVVIVTPDRVLARRIETHLARWTIIPHMTAGRPLIETTAGQRAMAVVNALADPADAVAFYNLIAQLPLDPESIWGVDLALRGPAPRDQAALTARLPEAVRPIHQSLITYGDLCKQTQPIADFAHTVTDALETWADEADALWGDDAGAALARLLRSLMEDTGSLPPVDMAIFAVLIHERLIQAIVPPAHIIDARVSILGTLESRFAEADLMILAGLEDGIWPATPEPDVFLSRPMRTALGLPPVERRIGLAAHDFAQAAAHERVLLVQTQKRDNAPTKTSRWLWRLKTLLHGAGVDLVEDRALHGLIAAMRTPARVPSAPRPCPCPPVAARPAQLSVTRIETLIRDPYAIYAQYVLKLKKLDAIAEPAGPRQRGTAWHKALERFDAANPQAAADALPEALIARGFPAEAIQREQWRFSTTLAALCALEPDDPPKVRLIESKGQLQLDVGGFGFTLTGVADRIDLFPDQAVVIDYKTGEAPSAKEARTGLAPQLPLLAAMLNAGAFEGALPAGPVRLSYYKLGGRIGAKHIEIAATQNADPDVALARLKTLIGQYNHADRGYLSRKHPKKRSYASDYDALARHAEWGRDEGHDDDGNADG